MVVDQAAEGETNLSGRGLMAAHQPVQYAQAQAWFRRRHLRDAEDFEGGQHQHQAGGQNALAMGLQAGKL